MCSSRGGALLRQVGPTHWDRPQGRPGKSRLENVWQDPSQRPSRLAQGWRYGNSH